MKQRLYLFDTTLRDGAQTPGIDFSREDKVLIARTLDLLGLDYVEGGYPGANPTDTAFFSAPPALAHAKLTAFGMTKRAGRSVSNDPGIAALLDAGAPAICFVAKSWDFHVTTALGCSLEENLEAIADSVTAAIERDCEAMVDCEHFFDGYKRNRKYALDCLHAAHDAGARWVILCDTNGGTLPHEIEEIVSEVVKLVPGEHVVHPHPQRHRKRCRQLAGRRARGAPDRSRAR